MIPSVASGGAFYSRNSYKTFQGFMNILYIYSRLCLNYKLYIKHIPKYLTNSITCNKMN